jgi:2-polyprenyl-3-methyl-5-hydroxy-6-metoxy-1,4-benzoquinol methylase
MVRKTVAKVTAPKSKKPFGKKVCLSHYTNSLKKRQDGIWYASKTNKVSYPAKGNEQCFGIEDKSFWFEHRNKCIIQLIKKFPPKGKGPIFDLGGGNGFVAKSIADAGWGVVLLEPSMSGVKNAKKRGLDHIICGTIESTNFKKGSLPAIGLFDVLEHIKDDLNILKKARQSLKPQGLIYLTVPAYNIIWSQNDVNAGHFRRYRLIELEQKLDSAGFSLIFGTYIFKLLVLPIFLFRALPYYLGILERNVSKKAHLPNGGLFSALIKKSFYSELTRIEKKRPSCFGSSCLLVARKIGNH